MTAHERTDYLRLAIERISEKWRIAVLHLLSNGPLRRSQLQRALEEVSPKVLTQTLRGLERDGLVEREAYAAAPLWVEYRLTEIARHLLGALEGLCRWSQAYGSETVLAQKRYDAERVSLVTPRPSLSEILADKLGDFSSRKPAVRLHSSL